MFLVYYFQMTFFKRHRSLIRLKTELHVFFFYTSGRSYRFLIHLLELCYILIQHREVMHEIVSSTLQMIK